MTAAPNLEPDRDAMLRHLEQVFGGAYEGAIDGLIELAWIDPQTGSLSRGQLFGTDQLEEITDRAAELNRNPGCNVYVGAALRKAGSPSDKRARDSDFYCSPFAWADIDENRVAAAIKTAKAAGVPPNLTVVTGRHPHLRAQLWWRLAEAETDAQAIRALCSTIAATLGGDSTVSNPSRVLRLGGSIAWPVKEGRVCEQTEVHVPQDGRPSAYWPTQLGKAFAPALHLESRAANAPTGKPTGNAAPKPSIEPFTPDHAPLAIGGLSVEAALAAVRRNDRWHHHAVRLVGNWVARGWSDAEILATAPALTVGGYTPDQTRRDLGVMIVGARRKWNVPNPAHAIEEKAPPAPITIEWEDGSNAAMIPRRRWLVGSFAIRGQLTVLVAPPGAGKSTLGISLGVAAATGRGEIVGETVHETVKAWVWNNEDDKAELRRRLAAVMHHWNVAPGDLRGRLALNSGSERPLIVARTTKEGIVLRLPDIDAIIKLVKSEGIGLLIVDPFVETHEVDENDNAQIKAVAAMWREVARRASCAVILVHHTGKPPAASPDAWAGSLHASRGASSLAGVARIVRTLFGMSERDAEKLGLEPEERHRFVRLDDAKANLSLASSSARWFQRIAVTIANGDEVGALVPADPASKGEPVGSDPEIERALLRAIADGWKNGAPLSEHPRAKERYAPRFVARLLRCSAEAVEEVLTRLMMAGIVRREIFDSKGKLFGLRITDLDERDPPRRPVHQQAETAE